MKKSLLLFVFTTLLISCSSKEEKTSLPDVLSKNEEVVIYFETFDEVINEYVSMIEELSEISKKQEGEQSFSNAMSAMTTVASSTAKMTTLLEKIEEIEAKGEIMKETLTEQEILAFAETYTKMLNRIQQASLKINK
jgi:uncharacterized protein YaaR (DUF327 family)